MAVRGVVVAKHVQHGLNLHARGVHGHQNLRLALVLGRIRVGDAHENHHLAARVASAGSPPLLAVDDVLVSIQNRRRADVGGVRGGHGGLGHGEGRANLAGEQRLEPLFFLLLGAVALQHLHVAGVGRRAVEHLGRPAGVPHQLRQRRVFQVAQPCPAAGFWQEHIPQPVFFGLFLEAFYGGDDAPAPALFHFAGHLCLVGKHVFFQKTAHALHPLARFFGLFKHG